MTTHRITDDADDRGTDLIAPLAPTSAPSTLDVPASAITSVVEAAAHNFVATAAVGPGIAAES